MRGYYYGLLIAPPVDDGPDIYEPRPLRTALLAAGLVMLAVAIPYLSAHAVWSFVHGH
jgi:hypothetical protein